jgi:FdhD protein
MWKRALRVVKVTDRDIKKQNDQIVVEKIFQLTVDNKHIVELSTISSQEKELAMGYLVGNNVITSQTKIVDIDTIENEIKVETDLSIDGVEGEKEIIESKKSEVKLTALNIFQLTAFFQEKSFLYKDTAITHSAAITSPKNILFFAEDISRMNSIYKVIGLGFNAKESFSDKVLITTGKIDEFLIKKVSSLGIPIIISRTAPTDRAFDYATLKGITIIGFARGKRFNIYTCPERVKI